MNSVRGREAVAAGFVNECLHVYTVASSDVIGERAFVADPWPRRYVRRLHVQQQQTLSATAALQRMRRLRQWLYAAHVLCFNCIADSYYGTFLHGNCLAIGDCKHSKIVVLTD